MTGPSPFNRIVRGLGALTLLTALVVGIPTALWAVAGSPLPDHVPSWAEMVSTFTHPDVTGTVLLGLLEIIGWIGWASFAVSVIVGIPSAVRQIPAPRLPGLRFQQQTASVLLAAVISMGAAGAAVASAPPANAAEAGNTAIVTIHEAVRTLASAAADTALETHVVQPAHAPSAAIPTSTTTLMRYTVIKGDNLWSIAEGFLGDGSRWVEIYDLNAGVTQADGFVLDDSHWIEPGWILTLPVAEAQVDGTPPTTHVVEPGESLSQIAQDELGDATRFPELFAASASVEQPGGVHLTDPNLILPGWTILIPGTTGETGDTDEGVVTPDPASVDDPSSEQTEQRPADTPRSEDGAPADTQAPQPTATHPPTTETTSTPTAEPDAATQSTDSDDADTVPVLVRTATGIGALLAAGIVGLLATKRVTARRRRPAGQLIAVPASGTAAADLEAQVRAVADPTGRETVDVALRSLATWHRENDRALPDVRAARLSTEQFELFLGTPTDLPAPWKPTFDRLCWRLAAEDTLSPEMVLAASVGEAPWPALVTLGHDDADAHIMLNLEQASTLDIRGEIEVAKTILAAVAIELATSPWADDLRVTLVGIHEDLPRLADTGRIRHVPSTADILPGLSARAEDVTGGLEHLGTSCIADARGRGIRTDAWTPEIVLVAEKLDEDTTARLHELAARTPGVGIAVVTAGAQTGEWTLDLDADSPGRALLEPAHLVIRPQQIVAADYATALELLAPPAVVDGPAWSAGLTDAEVPLNEIPAQPTLMLLAEPDGDDEPCPDNDAAPSVAAVAELVPPFLRILGPVCMEVASGIDIGPRKAPATELIAFIAFNPGAKPNRITENLWYGRDVTEKSRRELVSRTRNWLGESPDGMSHLPRFWYSSDGDRLDEDTAGYRLDGVRTDWHRFVELVGPRAREASTEDLLAALSLVRGRPFQDAPSRRYGWADDLIHEMSAAIVDVAHEVAHRALTTGDIPTARLAARIGRLADPVDERPWRDAIRAEWASGMPDAVNRLIQQLHDQIESIDQELEPETEDLIREISRRATRHGRALAQGA